MPLFFTSTVLAFASVAVAAALLPGVSEISRDFSVAHCGSKDTGANELYPRVLQMQRRIILPVELDRRPLSARQYSSFPNSYGPVGGDSASPGGGDSAGAVGGDSASPGGGDSAGPVGGDSAGPNWDRREVSIRPYPSSPDRNTYSPDEGDSSGSGDHDLDYILDATPTAQRECKEQ